MDKFQTIVGVGQVLDLLVMKKLEEDPDLELSIDDKLINQKPLLEQSNRVVHEEETDIESRKL